MDETTNTATSVNEGAEISDSEVKTYTQEEVDKLLQSEVDRRITSAQKKWQEKTDAKLKESERLAKMNEQEKYQYQLEQREKTIQERERQLALAENKNIAGQILNEKGISLNLVDFVVAEDADEMKSRIDTLEKAFKASVKQEVEKRMGSNIPKKNLGVDDTMTKQQFNKLSILEQQRLANENPDLIKQFM